MLASRFQPGPDSSPLSEIDRRALARFLEQGLDHGFRLAIVEAANHADREAILNDLASTIGDGLLRIAIDELPGADSNLWAALQEPFSAQKPRCLALWGFENLPRSDWTHQLNVQRDLFVRDFAVPWLLFIHPTSRVKLLQDAPDLCDFAIQWVRDERPPVAARSIGIAAHDSFLSAGPSDADNPVLRAAQEAIEAARFDAARDSLARFDLQPDQSILDRVRREYLGARLERKQGHLAAAEALIRSAKNILAQQPQGPATKTLAWAVDSELGTILLASGRLPEAEVLLRETLQAIGQTEGLDNPNYGAALNNLAIVLAKQGQHFEAERVMKDALDIQIRTLGREHYSYGASLNVLANILIGQGRYAEGERVMRECLDVHLKTSGREHPAYASSLHNLACALSAQDRHSEAESAYREALAIEERTLGREHPDYARSLHGLAEVLLEQEEHAEAAKLLDMSLPIIEKTAGKEHPDYGMALHNLAAILHRQGRYIEAVNVLRRSLSILERTLGPEHPDYANSLRSFGESLAGNGEYPEAERVLRKALSILEKNFGHTHPQLCPPLVRLAEVLASQSRIRQAIRHLDRALSISQATRGAEHPEAIHISHILKDLKQRRLRR